MIDAAVQYANDFDEESQRLTEIDDLAIRKTESHMRHRLDYQNVRNTIKRVYDEDEFFRVIAELIRKGDAVGLYKCMFAAIETDVYMWKKTEATDEVDNRGPREINHE